MSKTNTLRLSVSQNFLTCSKTIARLLRLTDIDKNDIVVEIGSGKGHITKALLRVSKNVISYELDSVLYEKLRTKLTNDNLKLYNQDFLKARLPDYGDFKIFSNIPFCITTKIINKLITSKNPPVDAWLIMEKGAAIRFCGRKSDNLYSLLLKPVYDMKIIYYFERTDFHPIPSVDIVMLHMHRKEKFDVPVEILSDYRNFTKKCYENGIKRYFTERQIRKALPQGFSTAEVLYTQWLCLFRSIYK